ncbi:Abi family protein [Methylovulum psychrotolerans]|uniref:Abi family protein n=1 Tax=Methylovulum psychrotolerans TaxID=1704499 RepID=UPI001BFF8A8A|nr:Abi family protein [Methylovulum psychrotolerans]MBT9100491.1 Abi family protein [Methylovulum psychrotolerans]
MIYDKPWKSYQDQLDQLTRRGLMVTDEARALHHLERIGYYRLSGYWFPFRERSGFYCPLPTTDGKKFKRGKTDRMVLDEFITGASFQNAVDLYVFDKRLRLLVLDALERIEVGLRVDISHTLGQKCPFAYLKPEFLFEGFSYKLDEKTSLTGHHQWVAKNAGLINRSKEEFITHNKAKYGLPLPIWVVCEIWDFGTLSSLFAGMAEADQDSIARKYGLSNGRVFASWLRSLNYLRNVCAHHSRLWNRNIAVRPQFTYPSPVFNGEPFLSASHLNQRVFLLLCISKHLLNIINPSSTWGQRLKELLLGFPDLGHLGIDLADMGAIEGWEQWEW